jgi:hypothetical protein
MPRTERGGAPLFRYLGVIGSVAFAAGLGISHLTIASEILGQRSPAKTVLDQRIENAREIKDALRTPQPPLEPLAPITAKLVKPKPNTLSPEAANAMAMAPSKPSTVSAAWCFTNPASCQRSAATR